MKKILIGLGILGILAFVYFEYVFVNSTLTPYLYYHEFYHVRYCSTDEKKADAYGKAMAAKYSYINWNNPANYVVNDFSKYNLKKVACS